jgi:hypothetical protein
MGKIFAIAMVTLAWGCGSVTDTPPDGPGGGGDGPAGDSAPQGVPVAPVAPSVEVPMYQGAQREFRTQLGGTCKGRVAASMGTTGFCYLAADDDVKCAGLIGGVDYGLTASSTGQSGAEQIMLFFGIGSGMCITRTDHTVQCMGTNMNAFDMLSMSFSRWTARNDIAAIASGTWDQICGITMAGQVYCGGRGNPDYGNPPIPVGGAGSTSLWVDTFGIARLNDTTVLRPAEGRTDCQVRANGLVCAGTSFGPTNGTVVSGAELFGGMMNVTCWLDSAGTVGCTNGPRFAPGKVLFLATNSYSDSLCAIYNDGSIWCIGSNSNGKFGTGNTAALATETMVAPPGTARVRCD